LEFFFRNWAFYTSLRMGIRNLQKRWGYMKRTISTSGLNELMDYESFVNHPYQDGKGVWTEGIGHTEGITKDSPNITREQAMKWLMEDLKPVEEYINEHFNLTRNQFDSLASLLFNVGVHGIDNTRLYDRLLNNPDDRHVAYEWVEFCLDDGDFEPGLLKRRCKEIIYYFS